MRIEQKTTRVEDRMNFIQKIEQLNPHHLFLYMSVLGSALIFACLLLAFNLSYIPEFKIYFPLAFIMSTVFLLVANLAVKKTVIHHNKENMHKVVVYSGIALMLGICYILTQFIAWQELYIQDVRMSGSAFGSYLFLISGLHVLHLVGGMIFLSITFFTYLKASVDPVKSLMLVTNPYQLVKLKMLVTCWNFLDIVWIAVMINFIILL